MAARSSGVKSRGHPRCHSSLVSSGARVQFAVGIALISIIPLLTFWYLNIIGGHEDGYPYIALAVLVPVLGAAGLGGFLILRKYPLNIVRLRGYLEEMIQGELPNQVNLLTAEDDIAAVEKCLNLIVAQLKERLAILKREKKDLQEQLYQTQKMESLGLMAAGVAHDFNNLLMGLMGNVDLISMHLPEDTEVQENMDQIQKLLFQASELTKQMLVYAGKAQFAMQSLDMSKLVEDMREFLKASVGSQVELVYELAEGLPPARADAVQIRQVIMNLLLNAKAAIGEEDGRITLATQAVGPGEIDLSGVAVNGEIPDGPCVCVQVADTGCGMPPDRQARMFDPFFTTTPKGRGLGLAVVLGLILGHHGAILVNSEPGKGTRIRALIPCADGPEPAVT